MGKLLERIYHEYNIDDFEPIYKDGVFSYYTVAGEKLTLFDILTDLRRDMHDRKHDLVERMLKNYESLIYSTKDENLISYYNSVNFENYFWISKRENNEFYYHGLFKNNVEKILPGYKLINKLSNPKHKPDAWVLKNKEEIPVEMKVKGFDEKALEQLSRYMKFYEKDKGIAIAEELKVDLPENIIFIPLKTIKDLEQQNS